MTYYICHKRDATFAIHVANGVVMFAAPYIARWAYGKPVLTVLNWMDKWEGPFNLIPEKK